MRCSTSRKAILADGLGLLESPARKRLEAHCAGCESCRDARSASADLDDGLRALRSLPVPEVDIRLAALERIASRPAAPARGFAWALTGAAAAAAGFTGLTVALLPHALPLLRAALHGGAALVRSTAPLLTLGSALLQICGLAVRPVLALLSAIGAAQPLTLPLLIAGGSTATAACLVIIGHGFLRNDAAAPRKES